MTCRKSPLPRQIMSCTKQKVPETILASTQPAGTRWDCARCSLWCLLWPSGPKRGHPTVFSCTSSSGWTTAKWSHIPKHHGPASSYATIIYTLSLITVCWLGDFTLLFTRSLIHPIVSFSLLITLVYMGNSTANIYAVGTFVCATSECASVPVYLSGVDRPPSFLSPPLNYRLSSIVYLDATNGPPSSSYSLIFELFCYTQYY